MNVFDFAMKMEVDAEAYYKKLAADSKVEGLKKIFFDLAADENRHFHIFESLKAGTPPETMAESTVLEGARNIFEALIRNKDQQGPVEGDLEGYRYALKLEAEGARVYIDAAKREKNEEVQKILLKIADEEKKHFNIIQNIYDFVNAPNEYLAWGEFSNIEEFKQFGRDVEL